MMPTIIPGDLILVEKISPYFRRNVIKFSPASTGDIIFFEAPPRLLNYIEKDAELRRKISVADKNLNIVENSKSRLKSQPKFKTNPPPLSSSTLIVKRIKSIVDVSGTDSVLCEVRGKEDKVQIDYYDVRGDNPDVSLDSRQWGCLSSNNVIGKPVLRLWPLHRVGIFK